MRREVYDAGRPGYRGRCTAPLLVDKLQRKLVCNESSDIVRMLNSLRLPGSSDIDLYPAGLAAEIDGINVLVQNDVRHSPLTCFPQQQLLPCNCFASAFLRIPHLCLPNTGEQGHYSSRECSQQH